MTFPDRRDLPQGPLDARTWPVRTEPPVKPRRRLVGSLLVAAVVLVSVAFIAGVAVWLARAGNQPGVTPASEAAAAPASEPKTLDAAKSAAQRAVDRFASGDTAGAWDLMSSAGKALILKADYVAFNAACPSGGVTFQVGEVRFETPDRVLAIIKSAAVTSSINVVYEDGAWRWQPVPELAADWGLPVKDRVAAAKADGGCGT